MDETEAQLIWKDYFDRIKLRRLAEASELWAEMMSKGISEESVLALDFRIFGDDKTAVQSAMEQLSENYDTGLEQDIEKEIWMLNGTTRPTGITLNKENHLDWVSFMADVSSQYGCVFSEWTLEAPDLKLIFRSIEIETE